VIKVFENTVFSILFVIVVSFGAAYAWFPGIMLAPFMIGAILKVKHKSLTSVFREVPFKTLSIIVVLSLVGAVAVFNDSLLKMIIGSIVYCSLLVLIYIFYKLVKEISGAG